MKRISLFSVFFLLLTVLSKAGDKHPRVESCDKCIVIAEQSQHRIVIADVHSGKVIWEWRPDRSNVQSDHVKWFSNPSEAKVVYNRRYVLMTASGGGVALIRIADKKVVFYAYAGGNTHSAELLPDGNIVSASSTGNFLTVFRTDTTHFPDGVYTKQVPIEFGHNVVWDPGNNKLWSVGMSSIHAFRYNHNCAAPDLVTDTTIAMPGNEGHDLVPVYGEKRLWLTNASNVYYFDVNRKKLTPADRVLQDNIKSVSSGPAGFPTIVIRPKESWWTDEVLDAGAKTVFQHKGWKIYKARWVLPDTFSNPDGFDFHTCK
ncbi:hypothetical protein CLV59_109210 [Chitinophaga dinghuensis]|uniref:Pyrroloquinoline-quinone binding quinoprotein n=1 Tax=Chitinophaga dinghuensis TaxID=1539050 RepID=A0A327VP99_9BACT|nr:DUF6528 family protein [Chitinophaga dinghuensis]RAJ75596.1 hypothetical protein CLV59_109210 [Chitinophaga dinghuensis]